MGVIITFGVVGGLLAVFGIIMLLFKSAIMMMSGYEPGKFDDEKLRKFLGWHLLVIGFGFLISSVLAYFIYDYSLIFILSYIPALIAIIIKMLYQGRRYRIK